MTSEMQRVNTDATYVRDVTAIDAININSKCRNDTSLIPNANATMRMTLVKWISKNSQTNSKSSLAFSYRKVNTSEIYENS